MRFFAAVASVLPALLQLAVAAPYEHSSLEKRQGTDGVSCNIIMMSLNGTEPSELNSDYQDYQNNNYNQWSSVTYNINGTYIEFYKGGFLYKSGSDCSAVCNPCLTHAIADGALAAQCTHYAAANRCPDTIDGCSHCWFGFSPFVASKSGGQSQPQCNDGTSERAFCPYGYRSCYNDCVMSQGIPPLGAPDGSGSSCQNICSACSSYCETCGNCST